LEEIKENSIKTELKLKALKKYEEFLEKFREKYSDEFPEIPDIINRFVTLKKTNEKLNAQHEKCEEDLAKITKETNNFEQEKNKEIYFLNNDISSLKVKYYELKSKKNDLLKNVEISAEETRKKTTELGQLLMAIDNLYERCKEQRGKNIKRRIDNDGKYKKDFDNIEERSKIKRNNC